MREGKIFIYSISKKYQPVHSSDTQFNTQQKNSMSVLIKSRYAGSNETSNSSLKIVICSHESTLIKASLHLCIKLITRVLSLDAGNFHLSQTSALILTFVRRHRIVIILVISRQRVEESLQTVNFKLFLLLYDFLCCRLVGRP